MGSNSLASLVCRSFCDNTFVKLSVLLSYVTGVNSKDSVVFYNYVFLYDLLVVIEVVDKNFRKSRNESHHHHLHHCFRSRRARRDVVVRKKLIYKKHFSVGQTKLEGVGRLIDCIL